MDNINSYAHTMPVNSGNFVHSMAQMPSTITPQTPSLITYLDAGNRIQSHTSNHWAPQLNRSHHTTNQIINDTDHLTSNHTDAIRLDMSKTYPQTIINDDESGDRTTIMETFLEHKGSENVKRFSVNNLLQLANNCRAISNEQHRNTMGEFFFLFYFTLFLNRQQITTSAVETTTTTRTNLIH